jgi:drug/metabolite transporter (DMT)-like permease
VAFGERLHARRWLGILLSMAGMVAIGLKTLDPQSGISAVGLGWLLASSIVWAFYTVLQRPWLGRLTPLQFNAVAYGLGSLPYVVFGAPQAFELQTLQAPPTAWLGLAAVAITGQFLGIFGWSKGVAAFGPTRTAVFLNLLPIYGLLAAVVVLGERPSLLALVATTITLSGVYLTNSRSPQDRV